MSAGWDTLGLEDGSSHTLAATATHDGGSPVADAAVSGAWSGGASGSAARTTRNDGRCAVSVSIRKNEQSVTFTVEGVGHAELAYDATANTDPDGDSEGARSRPSV